VEAEENCGGRGGLGEKGDRARLNLDFQGRLLGGSKKE